MEERDQKPKQSSLAVSKYEVLEHYSSPEQPPSPELMMCILTTRRKKKKKEHMVGGI